MKLKRVKASKVNVILKASVHKTGRLGFSSDAADFMELKEGYSAEILMNEEDDSDKDLYIQIHQNQDDKDNFKIGRAGEYYYIALKLFYSNRNEDYVNQDISYDISLTTFDGEPFYLLKRRLVTDNSENNEE